MKAWKERQDRIKSASLDWTEEQTDTRGSISRIRKLIDPKLAEVIPPKDMTFSNLCSASLDGNKLRYAYTAMQWSNLKKGYEPCRYVSVFDGGTCALLHGPASGRAWHQGQVRQEAYHVEYSNVHLQPILMTFRAMTPRMRWHDIANFELTGLKTVIGASPCLELSQRPSNDIENRLWVDPARGFVVTRCLTLIKGIVKYKLDIRYRLGPEQEWVPDQWTIISNKPDGRLDKHYRARVTRCELNGAIPKEEFEMRFPPGTRVIDEKDQLDYIVRPDGSGKRILAPSERTLTYAQLMNSEPGSVLGGSINWPAIVVVTLALVGLAIVLLRRSRQKKRSTS